MDEACGSTNAADSSVLVVEDEYFLADDLAHALQSAGVSVVGPVATLQDAIAILSTPVVIDAAILDVNLAGDKSWDVAAALDRRKIPFVFATGYDTAAISEEYQQVARWQKPFEPEALVQSLIEMVKR